MGPTLGLTIWLVVEAGEGNRDDVLAGVDAFTCALALDPSNLTARFYRAELFARQGAHDLALEDLAICRERKRDWWLAELRAGVEHALRGDAPEAIEALRRARDGGLASPDLLARSTELLRHRDPELRAFLRESGVALEE